MTPSIQQFRDLVQRVKVLEEKQSQHDVMSALHMLSAHLTHMEKRIMASLDETLAAATEEDTKTDSIIALLAGIKAQLDVITAGGLSPAAQAKVDQLFAQLTANSGKIQTAIDANTPSA